MYNKVIEILEKDYAYNSKNDCGFSEFQKLLIKDVIDIVSNPHERVVIQKNTEIFKMQLHQTIDLQDEEGFAIYGYLPYKYITRVPGGWIYSNYDAEKDAYVPMDKIFVPFNNDMQ